MVNQIRHGKSDVWGTNGGAARHTERGTSLWLHADAEVKEQETHCIRGCGRYAVSLRFRGQETWSVPKPRRVD